jgi:hypothetical protein
VRAWWAASPRSNAHGLLLQALYDGLWRWSCWSWPWALREEVVEVFYVPMLDQLEAEYVCFIFVIFSCFDGAGC